MTEILIVYMLACYMAPVLHWILEGVRPEARHLLRYPLAPVLLALLVLGFVLGSCRLALVGGFENGREP